MLNTAALSFILISPWYLLQRLGGVGLIALGIADSSLAPLPGSIDALTIVLCASNRDWWPYYALMATVGSVAGGYITYGIGRKGGEQSLERKLSKRNVQKVYKFFNKGGFGAVFVPALLPPPVPMVPFVLAAGAMNYSRRNFLVALSTGRALRFTLVAYLASIYGRRIFGFFRHYGHTVLWTFVGIVVAGGVGLTIYLLHRKRSLPAGSAGAVPAAKLNTD